MKLAAFLKAHYTTIVAIGSALSAISVALEQYLAENKAPTLPAIVMVIGVAVAGWLSKRPGDLSPKQADAHAEKAVQRAVGMPEHLSGLSQMPPAMPGDDTREY